MNNTPEHLKNPHLSAWSIGLTIAGCSLAMFSPLVINKNPQLGIVGTSAGAVLSIAGWVMGSQSEKSIKLQAKVEEQTEAIFLRRLGMEYELEKFRDVKYLDESQQMILQPKQNQILPQQNIQTYIEPENNSGNIALLNRVDDEIFTTPVINKQILNPVESVLERGYFESIDELKQVIWLEENEWFKACVLNKLLMLIGDQGCGKTTFAQFVLGCRILLKNHQVFVADPHAEKNGWSDYFQVSGYKKDWGAIENRIDKYFNFTTNTLQGDSQQYSFLFDEMTQYKDCLQDSKKAGLMLKSWCSDVRKSSVSIICLTHNDTCEALAGVKGMKDSIDSSFLKLFLSNISDPETGDFKPSHRGYISNFKKDAKNQSIDVQIKTSVWMQFKYLEPLFKQFDIPSDVIETEVVISPKINLKKDDVPSVLQSINPLDCNTWQSIDYPSGLQWLPQHEAGVYCVFVDGYQNPLYVGQSKDLWRRWNNKGDWEHRVKKHLESIGDVSVKIAFYITKNWDEQKRLSLESELQAKYKPSWNGTANKTLPDKTLSESAQAVFNFIKEIFKGEPIPARDCYRKSSLRTQFGLNAETTELIFDELQNFGLGQKLIKEINGFRSVNFLPDM
jgi:ABC-type dipeptide/oligopeptide/nickel transport system ATPase subunit